MKKNNYDFLIQKLVRLMKIKRGGGGGLDILKQL
jgi:hypothetical protein